MGEEMKDYLLPPGSSNAKINVAQLSTGIYFCKMQTGDKVSVVKFIKQ